jgi:hypothetical protein
MAMIDADLFFSPQLLGGLAILLGIPFPVFLWYKGAALRAANPLTAKGAQPKAFGSS